MEELPKSIYFTFVKLFFVNSLLILCFLYSFALICLFSLLLDDEWMKNSIVADYISKNIASGIRPQLIVLTITISIIKTQNLQIKRGGQNVENQNIEGSEHRKFF